MEQAVLSTGRYSARRAPGHHLILGGCGFIGHAVALMLARAGEKVVLADRVAPAYAMPADIAERISYVPFELRTADWDRLMEGATVIHHYAWTSVPASANLDPAGDLLDNVLPTLALLNALVHRGVEAPRLVFASSGGTVYGKLRCVPVPEDHPLQPITAYGAGKAAAEVYISQYRAMQHLDCRIARLANPFGTGQNIARGQGAVTTFLHHALTGRIIELWGDGEVVRDYIHVSDAAAGLISLASAPLNDGPWIFNIGSGRGLSLNEIVVELEALLNRRLLLRRGPGRPFDVPVSLLDISRAKELLGWQPRLSFAEGLRHMIAELDASLGHTG